MPTSPPTDPTSLVPLLEAHGGALAEVAATAQARDEPGFQAAIAGLLTALVTEIPVVGSLARIGYREVFAQSAYGRARATLDAFDAEDQDQTRAHATARAVAEVLAPSLASVGEGLDALRARLEALETRPAGSVHVRQEQISAGVGVHVRTGFDKDVDIHQDHIRGGTGVVLGGG